jgi:hypothetical protein
MSSATSTETVGLPAESSKGSLQPWHFFVLAALACATVVTYLVRGQGVTAVIFLTLLMGSVVLVGIAALLTVRPLVSSGEDRTPMVGERTRAGLEREKQLALRAIKELEFDKAMGKVSEEDFHEMAARLRSRASRLIRQLDAGAGYRARIEQDVAKRLGEPAAAERQDASPAERRASSGRCAACSTANEGDARFCKGCGARL